MILALFYPLRGFEPAMVVDDVEVGKRHIFPGKADIVLLRIVQRILLVKTGKLQAWVQRKTHLQDVQVNGRCGFVVTNLREMVTNCNSWRFAGH